MGGILKRWKNNSEQKLKDETREFQANVQIELNAKSIFFSGERIKNQMKGISEVLFPGQFFGIGSKKRFPA
jgi:hypothetical protein